MTENELFYLVSRTLNRLDLSLDRMPAKLNDWQEFLLRINRGFFDFEQERYLLERSMEISSREMRELNEKFEQAQATAHIGLWIYDKIADRILWSAETYKLFGINPALPVPPYSELLSLIHEEDRSRVAMVVDRAFKEHRGYEEEFRIKNLLDGNYYWVLSKGEVQYPGPDQPIRYLAGITMDITERKRNEAALKELQKKLLMTARQAGMSEVATSVLHNIGNVLNSVNISVALIEQFADQINIQNFDEVNHMIRENLPTNPNYLLSDPKGKLILNYLREFNSQLDRGLFKIKNEIKNLNININHIKDLVIKQRDISGILGVAEKISLSETVDIAIQMSFPKQTGEKITIVKDYKDSLSVTIDKAKLLEILVNLIKNAKESIMLSNNKDKTLKITIQKSLKTKFIEIIVSDNGCGINKNDVNKIFSFGYTTKKGGHGFGLHSSANSANELGGSLKAESEGIDQGANFILQLPEEYVNGVSI